VLDELRIYSRFLTEEEIRLLSTDPDNNHAPVIENVPAALDRQSRLEKGAHRIVTDDGQPFGSTLSTRGASARGPGQVIFDDASDPATSVTFTRTGEYAIMLSAPTANGSRRRS
jgi:hypothetical protein